MLNLLLPLVVWLSASPSVVCDVIDAGSFQRAASASATQDVTLFVHGQIAIESVYFPKSTHVVRVIGVGNQPEVRFTKSWNGNWNQPFVGSNGLEFNCRQVVITGLIFRDWDWQGAAIKLHGPESVVISGCTFQNISKKVYAPRVVPSVSSSDIWLVQVLAGWGDVLTISNCRFQDCAVSNGIWNHCIYLSANKSLVVANNTFEGCGSAVSLSGVFGASYTIVGNQYRYPVPTPQRSGPFLPAWEYLSACDFVSVGNSYSGVMNMLYYGSLGQAVVDWNDYERLSVLGSTTIGESGVGYHSWEWWVAHGFDMHSKSPTTRPG